MSVDGHAAAATSATPVLDVHERHDRRIVRKWVSADVVCLFVRSFSSLVVEKTVRNVGIDG